MNQHMTTMWYTQEKEYSMSCQDCERDQRDQTVGAQWSLELAAPQPPTAMQGGKKSFRWAGGRLGVNAGEKLPFVMLRKFASVNQASQAAQCRQFASVLVSFFLPGFGAKLELLGLASQQAFSKPGPKEVQSKFSECWWNPNGKTGSLVLACSFWWALEALMRAALTRSLRSSSPGSWSTATWHAAQPSAPLLLGSFRTFFFFYTLQKHVQIKHVEAWQHQNEEMQELRGLTGSWESRAHRSPLQESAEVTHSQDRSVWSERSVESIELKTPFCTNTLQLKRSHIGKTSNFLGALQILESYFDISLCTYNTLTGGKKTLNSCRTSR